ncbi:enhancer of polycomb homolog 1-like [Ornithodoros turicata]|uniref:Enhancer of polycomb-like protein n=1 Tax=Ornithodoros turicata TaxID=34597 RepID=A0A2R5L927_9ACAR
MSKLSFRARALDASKPMPIYRSEEIPDLPDFAAINRAVPQMPTGMEKEEECEHHLQRAISAQQAFGHTGELVIPTPEVFTIEDELFDELYPPNYKISRQLIHMQPFAMDQDIPDYDMDSEDEKWLNQQAKKMDINHNQFEEMMDRLEKGSGQQVVTLHEAKTLLKEDDDLIIAVYDYWLNKRLRTQCPLVPQVKTEKRDGSNTNNPYVAFRRRTEKMQTRKNRKNDEASYEKMLKLRRDLSRAVTLLEMVKRREKTKREHLHLTIEVFEKRYQVGDFSGQIMAEVMAMKNSRPSYISVNNSHVSRQEARISKHRVEDGIPRKKREYTKRRNKDVPSLCHNQVGYPRSDLDLALSDVPSSEDEALSPATSPSDNEDENDPDGPFAFRRKKYCNYHAPLLERLGNYPWCGPEEGGPGDRKYRYCLTTITMPRPQCIGFARRRIGRGGRILLDRAWTPLDDYWPDLDVSLSQSMPNGLPPGNEFLAEIKNEWLHFRPQQCTAESWTSSTVAPQEASNTLPPQTPSLAVTGTDLESFQNHQEELFEMQRKQLERLKGAEESGSGGGGTPSVDRVPTQPASNFTLDPASVEFAVSAVRSTTEFSGILSSLTPHADTFSQPGNMVANGPDGLLGAVRGNDIERGSLKEVKMEALPEVEPCIPMVPSTDLGSKLPSSLADLRFPLLEQNGQEANKNRRDLGLPRVKLEPVTGDAVLPADVT